MGGASFRWVVILSCQDIVLRETLSSVQPLNVGVFMAEEKRLFPVIPPPPPTRLEILR